MRPTGRISNVCIKIEYPLSVLYKQLEVGVATHKSLRFHCKNLASHSQSQLQWQLFAQLKETLALPPFAWQL